MLFVILALDANRIWLRLLKSVLYAFIVINVLSFFGSSVNEFDDVIPLLHGQLVREGRIPGLDFYSFYPPLGTYLHAGMFALFGQSIISARIIGLVFYLWLLWLMARLWRARFEVGEPLVVVSLLLVAAIIGAGLSVASWPGFALSVIALLSYLRAQSSQKRRMLNFALAGLLTAAAILYRINFGGYVAVVAAVDLILQPKPRPLKAFFTDAAVYGAALLLGVAVICLLIFGSNTGRAALDFIVTAQK